MRTILHADLNAFYASVECLDYPCLKHRPMAVCGDPQLRHGIVLAKNEPAKLYGVQTGQPIWQARQTCPGLIVLPAHHEKYRYYSQRVQKLYAEYSDRVEPFGLDEAWIDVSGDPRGGRALADELRLRVKADFGLTLSVGVADNKVFAKLGSDMKKPDATTVLLPDETARKVWPLPVSSLLYVGPSTGKKLCQRGIRTIGDLACCSPDVLRRFLGKQGELLHRFANGRDTSPVMPAGWSEPLKSIGNSTTTARDLHTYEEARHVFIMLAESVGGRLREQGMRCQTLQISIRDSDLFTFERQIHLDTPTDVNEELTHYALVLFRTNYGWRKPIRSLGLRALSLCSAAQEQLSFFDHPLRDKWRAVERSVDSLRRKYGKHCLQRACLMEPAFQQIGEGVQIWNGDFRGGR